MSTTFHKGELIELEILDTAEDDACMGTLPDGMVVFVRGLVAPGDRVRAAVSKIKKNYLEARLMEILRPSPDRVEPRCAHYGVCGGCKWQHVRYERQCSFKRKVVQDALRHLGGFSAIEVAEPIASDQPYHYRNKVDFTFSNERFILEEELAIPDEERGKPSDFALGFHRRGCFHKIIDIDRCHIASERSNRILALTNQFFLNHRRRAYSTMTHDGFLRNLMIRHAGSTGELMVNVITSAFDAELMEKYRAHLADLGAALTTVINSTTTRKNLVAYGEEHHVLHGPGFIREELNGLSFIISPNSFFQTNSAQALKLYQTATRMAALQADEVLYDLYCGTGSITLFAGRGCRAAYGFELEPSAVADARINAQNNGIAHCAFVATDMKHLREAMLHAADRPDVIITDPPRAGMHEKAVETVRALAPRRIVYISCHPGSLARDARALCKDGMYCLREVQPVDLFPHTFHIESVACLDRIDRGEERSVSSS